MCVFLGEIIIVLNNNNTMYILPLNVGFYCVNFWGLLIAHMSRSYP
jgi:hypothetical protein